MKKIQLEIVPYAASMEPYIWKGWFRFVPHAELYKAYTIDL